MGGPRLEFWLLLSLFFAQTSFSQAKDIRICGKKLVELVMKLCKGCVQGVEKRSSGGHTSMHASNILSNPLFLSDLSSRRPHTHPNLVPHPTVLIFTQPHEIYASNYGRRTKRQIADQCCVNQCSYDTLMSYCCDDEAEAT